MARSWKRAEREVAKRLNGRRISGGRHAKEGGPRDAAGVRYRLVAKGRRGPKAPKRIKAFTKAWQADCKAAGCPGRIPHDLRRSAVRTFVRAGISETVAMKLSGHLTPSVFRRYDITSDSDLREAANRLDRDSFGTVGTDRAHETQSAEQVS